MYEMLLNIPFTSRAIFWKCNLFPKYTKVRKLHKIRTHLNVILRISVVSAHYTFYMMKRNLSASNEHVFKQQSTLYKSFSKRENEAFLMESPAFDFPLKVAELSSLLYLTSL